MCSSDHRRLHCVRFASVRSVATALSSESQPAIWSRSDRDRKGFDPTFCKKSACYSAKLRAVSAARRRHLACVTGAFSLFDNLSQARLHVELCLRDLIPTGELSGIVSFAHGSLTNRAVCSCGVPVFVGAATSLGHFYLASVSLRSVHITL